MFDGQRDSPVVKSAGPENQVSCSASRRPYTEAEELAYKKKMGWQRRQLNPLAEASRGLGKEAPQNDGRCPIIHDKLDVSNSMPEQAQIMQ